MKATRANLLGEFTGKLDGLIYYKSRTNGKLYVRKQFTFRDHPDHPRFRSAQKAIFALKPTTAYIRDLKTYLLLYNQLHENHGNEVRTWTNLYVKLMYALQKAYPESVNLIDITRDQITEQGLPCRSVRAAVDAGLLPVVQGYERFSAEI